jgi:hypothetical protein
LKNLLRQSFQSWLILVKLTLPALICVRLLTLFGLIGHISKPFEPLMTLMGLPKETALCWVTAMLTNNYTGIVVYLELLPIIGPQTVLQATVIASVFLIAHNLPVESGVCRGAGVSPLRMTILRLVAAAIYGITINQLGLAFGFGQQTASVIVGMGLDPLPPWGDWIISTIKSLAAIYLIVVALMLMMVGLRKTGLIRYLAAILDPLMRLSGVSPKATMITVFGMIVGLAYGGGLIIAESKSGRVPKPDVFGSITLMAMCHSLFEDTIILAALGGSLWGLLFGRIVFSVILTRIIVHAASCNAAKPFIIGKKYI